MSATPMSITKRNAITIMFDTVHALLMRELKTRFGANRLGYFWAIVEPVAQASIFAVIFTVLGRKAVAGVPVALFLLSGILAFNLFSKLLPQLSSAIKANKALFSYRQVTAIDPVITRLIIELATFIVVYTIILLGLAWLGFEVMPDDFPKVLLATSLLIILTTGLGLILCSLVSYWQDTPKIVSMVMRPMFFMSGVFYCATMIPKQYWYLFDWNPIFHAIELSRDAFFSGYTTPIGSWEYLSVTALVCFATGLGTFQLSQQRFISS
jgi:capsular polysaccharide transport system permease protein